MRKLWIFAAVAAIALTACQQEKDVPGGKSLGKNGIAFKIEGAATRSSSAVASVTKGVTIPFAKVDGLELTMEETISDLNYAAPQTKGTPVYTENVGYLYKGKLGVFTDAAGGVEASYALLADDPTPEGWIYQHEYTQNIWPDEKTDVQFYLRMPTDMVSYGVTSLNNENGITTVTYTSPTSATEQQDIIFGAVKMNHKTYMGHYSTKGGAPVTMYHALTGVKFAIANDAAELAHLHIDRITFFGLKNTGTFTFTASTEAIEWTSSEATSDSEISQQFGPDDLVTYTATAHADQNFAPSFFNGGAKQNLNDDQATKTFWLVPQMISSTSTATMLIEYTLNGSESWMAIDLKELHEQDWQAGQIRTYTFKVNDVNVKIEDDVVVPATAAASNAYADSYKENVEITNTGNTLAFIRAALVGQWMHEEEVDGVVETYPIFGFTDNVNNLYVVESWYEDQFMNTGDPVHGEFEGLPGYRGQANPNANGWVLCTDGYYYYTKAVPPYDSEKTKEQNRAAGAICKPLFTKYTVKLKPQATSIAGEVMDVTTMHFELEVAAQAISAVQRDGTVKKDTGGNDDWAAAWANVLDSAPVKKQ